MYHTDFQVEVSQNGVTLNRENVEQKRLAPLWGLCAAVPGLSYSQDHEHFPGYPSIPPRTIDQYQQKVLEPLIKAEIIHDGNNGSVDDRKLRYSGCKIVSNDCLEMYIGRTHFYAVCADLNRSAEENLQLQELGLRDLNDRYAFFARSLGVTVLPITKDGTIFIGERTNRELAGLLNGAAGYLEYKSNIQEFNPENDARRELREEFGVNPQEVQELVFAGLFSSSVNGNINLAYIAKVVQDEKYFSSGEWKRHALEIEHQKLIRLATIGEIEELLETGKTPQEDRRYSVMPGTIGALLSVRPEEIRN